MNVGDFDGKLFPDVLHFLQPEEQLVLVGPAVLLDVQDALVGPAILLDVLVVDNFYEFLISNVSRFDSLANF